MIEQLSRAASLAAVISLVVAQVYGQPPPEPPPAAPPEPAPDPSVGGGDGQGGQGGAADITPQPVPEPSQGGAAPDDDLWETGEPYVPMVEADYSRQPPGEERWEHHQHRWIWHNLTAVRINPLGLTNRFRTGYRGQISDRPEPIFDDSFWSAQLDTEITPAFGYAGARLEIQPAVLFNFWVSYGVVGTFGTFATTHSFPDVTADYRDDTLRDTKDLDYSTIGQRLTTSGLFQFGLGGVAFRDNVMLHWADMDLHEGDRVFYDAALDVLMPNGGFAITNDADLLILTEFNLKFGLRYTLTAALYQAEHLAGGPNLTSPHHRLGPAFLYTFFEDPPGTAWNKPTLFLLTQWFVDHHYRTSDKPALPYMVFGFIQEGDFMASAKE